MRPAYLLRFLAVPAILVLVSTPALATHVRPKGANPFYSALVPAYQQCSAPDRTHGPPLSFGSCSSPSPTSQYVTVGTPDANGAAAKSVGSVRWTAYLGVPGPPHDTQSFFEISFTDLRCTAAATTCGSANAAGGSDYTGELEGVFALRFTDHLNGPDPQFGCCEPGTMTDYTFRFRVPCSSTTDATEGARCIGVVNPSAVVPGWTPEGRRSIFEIAQAQFYDGGADGVASSAGDNTLFAVQGLFVP
jgi:hypothetical protein